jgi:hypothetical protein
VVSAFRAIFPTASVATLRVDLARLLEERSYRERVNPLLLRRMAELEEQLGRSEAAARHREQARPIEADPTPAR